MSIKILQQPVLDPASTTILITGASGFIASNVVYEALQLGYKVRGTARTEEKALRTEKLFNNPNYSTVIVSDLSASEQITEAVKGVAAIIHLASDVSFSEDAKIVVEGVVNGTKLFLRAANKEPSVKRFVLTSSSSAAVLPIPNKEMTITTDSWSDNAVDTAFNKKGESVGPNGYAFVVYAASKTQGERAFWEFVKEEKPHFVCNTILPNTNIGRILDSPGPTGGLMLEVYNEGKFWLPPQYAIDVVDNARLHLIAAVLDGDIHDERIFAFAMPFNRKSSIETIKKLRPDWKGFEVDENEGEDLSKVPNERGAALLKKWYGQDGYSSLESMIKANLEGV